MAGCDEKVVAVKVDGGSEEIFAVKAVSFNQSAPGKVKAVKVMPDVLLVLTRIFPVELPGAEPSGILNWLPEGYTVMLAFCDIDRDTGTEDLPAVLEISTLVR